MNIARIIRLDLRLYEFELDNLLKQILIIFLFLILYSKTLLEVEDEILKFTFYVILIMLL